MNWMLGILFVLLIVGFVAFGGLGGMTAILMVVALGAGIFLFRQVARDRRRIRY
jgi:hypothetical protein